MTAMVMLRQAAAHCWEELWDKARGRVAGALVLYEDGIVQQDEKAHSTKRAYRGRQTSAMLEMFCVPGDSSAFSQYPIENGALVILTLC